MAAYYITNIADILRAAGCQVVEHPGWQTRGHGGLATSKPTIVWHHDASPKGRTPGVAAYMLAMLAKLRGSVGDAQLWVDYDGVWHVLGCGKAYHAGVTKPGKPGNPTTLGVETDHTVDEAWPVKQLESLRRGTAALLRAFGHSSGGLEFHKTIAFPPGRKVDPDGLDLSAERTIVGGLIVALGTKVTGGRAKPATVPATSSSSSDARPFGWLARRNGAHVDAGTYRGRLSIAALNAAMAAGAKGRTGQKHGALEEVRILETALDRVNYLIPEYAADQSAGTATQVAVDRYRRDIMGLKGTAATGSVGAQSLAHLMHAAGIRATWSA
ncbi:N-acetylmuramoyl-L-alanine amidase [uncultured Arsenicicoccus sp.]|uniref:peptidoglycan recognition protein family protein n=1 Tax=uncultured Arsenicicoccus sp. TaxID=491339 RepID=UPI002591C804|nr:N-acetylmuramoyl-L-alanine amidase [uncultured Arsenicicoccus sp.]